MKMVVMAAVIPPGRELMMISAVMEMKMERITVMMYHGSDVEMVGMRYKEEKEEEKSSSFSTWGCESQHTYKWMQSTDWEVLPGELPLW